MHVGADAEWGMPPGGWESMGEVSLWVPAKGVIDLGPTRRTQVMRYIGRHQQKRET